jgi:hypothetical protein
MAASLSPLAVRLGTRRHLDLERCRLVVDLERRVLAVEALL